MLAARVGILVVIVLHYPSYTIKSFAYGQATASTILLVAYWAYFWYQFRQKAILMKNRELHQNNPLLALPFNSLKDFLPRKLEGQVHSNILISSLITLPNWHLFPGFYWRRNDSLDLGLLQTGILTVFVNSLELFLGSLLKFKLNLNDIFEYIPENSIRTFSLNSSEIWANFCRHHVYSVLLMWNFCVNV